jgi:cytochrome c-type biogenesis protein CcmH/NrfG
MIGAILVTLILQSPAARTPSVPDRATLLTRAAEALQRGHRADAKQLLATAGRRHGSVKAWLQLARLESEDGRAADAMRALGEARTLAPNSEEVLSAIAELSLRVHTPVQGILALESLTRIYPSEARYAYLLGVGLMTAGDMIAAIDVLRRANTLEPDRPRTLLALGLAYNNQKLFADARPLLRRALDLDPQSVETLAALSEASAGDGDLASAERDAARVLERDAQNATANLVIGMVRMAQQRYAEGRDALNAAAASDPRSPKPEYQLSLVYARMGDQANSERHLDLYKQKLRALEAAVKALHETNPGGPQL